MKSILMVPALVAGVCLLTSARADDNGANPNRTEMHEAGIGVSAGSYQGNNQGAVGAQGMNTRISNGEGTNNEYLSSQWNLDLGLAPGQQGLSFGINEKSGVNLWQRSGNEAVVPLLGLEPLNMAAGTSIGFNSIYTQQQTLLGPVSVRESDPHRMQGHTPFFEWSPMAAAGVQLMGDSCKAMIAVRGGASIGTLGDGGLRPAYGAGISGVCRDLVQFDLDAMRIANSNTETDMANGRVFLEVPGQHFGVGVAFDAMDTKANTGQVYSAPVPSSSTAEVRGQAVIGGVF